MFDALLLWARGAERISSPTKISGKSLNFGEAHDAVDLAEEVAYRFGWTRNKQGNILDARAKRVLAVDGGTELLCKMEAVGWIQGQGRSSRVDWGRVQVQDASTAVARLLQE